jgi:hypothetical protein
VDEQELARVCPHGVVVVRLSREVRVDLTRSWRAVAGQVTSAMAAQRPLTPMSAAVTSVRVRAWGFLPLVATFLGFVVLAADLTALGAVGPALEPPGAWARTVDRHRFATPPGGRPTLVWTHPRLP